MPKATVNTIIAVQPDELPARNRVAMKNGTYIQGAEFLVTNHEDSNPDSRVEMVLLLADHESSDVIFLTQAMLHNAVHISSNFISTCILLVHNLNFCKLH